MPLFLIGLLLSFCCLSAIAQVDNPYTRRQFNSKEIKDSSFREVYLVRYYYDYNYSPEWKDSFYVARFDKLGRIIYEKTHPGIGDSTAYHYSYTDQNTIRIIQDEYFNGKHRMRRIHHYNSRGQTIASGIGRSHAKNPGGQAIDTSYYDKENKLVKSERINGNPEWSSQYIYDEKDRLQKVMTYVDDSSNMIWHYEYNDIDSISRIRTIETYGRKTDSVIYHFAYDDKKRMIEKSRQPSKTYHKTFGMDCSTGDFYCYQYGYDSLNRVIFEADKEHEIRGKELRYASVIYTLTHYNEHGYTKQSYDLHNKPSFNSIYNRYEIRGHYGHTLRESYDVSSILTTYLSRNSNLPKTIDEMGSFSADKVTTVFTYYK